MTKSKVSVCTAEEAGLPAHPTKLSCTNFAKTCHLFKSSSQSNATQDPCFEAVLSPLRRRCQILCAKYDAPHRYADEKQKIKHESDSISQTLSSDLLEHIETTFFNAYLEHQYLIRRNPVTNINYDRQLNTPSMVQKIEELQAKLHATKDEDEQRALEEDITGKARMASICYLLMLKMDHSLIDTMALLVGGLCSNGPTVTKGC
ncbi:hypothetical protein M404DRAFT_765819 [Pisolithus tinctorius Marx 270]|uniref:Uncharacterized protein n=1 Tax=Pisolithus tinctorius Marx 270 TaxID=870435 RepID=A0A0C3NY36_PISTI|nr:hypothetical protein M404DRAFT_765819 [Pisolithus tinctorius Marx 270]